MKNGSKGAEILGQSMAAGHENSHVTCQQTKCHACHKRDRSRCVWLPSSFPSDHQLPNGEMLFASFKYHISPSFTFTRIEELKHVLDRNGAHEAGLKEVNLVITNSMKFEGWEEVKEKNESRKTAVRGEEAEEVYVVTDKWVDRSLVLGKVQSYVLLFYFISLINTNFKVHIITPPTHL